MQDDRTKHLKFDRRLAGRRGWVNEAELARSLESLPDVAAKAEVIDAPAVGRRGEPSPQGS